MSVRAWRWALLPAAALMSGCWVSKDAGLVMQRDIAQLKEGLGSVREGFEAQRSEINDQLQRGDAKIDEVDRKLQDLNRAARKTDAGFGVRLDELQRELQELRGQNEHLTYRMSQLEQKLAGLDALTQRIDALESSTGAAPPAAASSASSKEPMPTDKAGLLAKGQQLIARNALEEARGVLREVIERWPKDAGAADEAYFHIGESYFKEKKYRPALQEYIHVVEKFPKGKLVPNAYYRIGLCSVELGNLEDAIIFFDVILKDHKSSSVAKQARRMRSDVAKRLEKEKKG